MKPITPKQPFYGDFYIIRSNNLASISIFLRLITIFLLIFSSTLSSNFDTLAIGKNHHQLPVKKVASTSAKRASSSKIVKSKKVRKSKKKVIVKRDTLLDIDPATTNSPLFKN